MGDTTTNGLGVHIEARHLSKKVRSGDSILHDISLNIEPNEFVVLVGLTGAGKSTLMNALSGFRPATDGEVLVEGVNLYDNFDTFRTSIGYVPQRDIIHMDLTVFEGLDYAAKLRLPPETTRQERHARIEQVMADLDLTGQRDIQVKDLSGGQQKRVSIGVELITSPKLFFLDEPTSGLDPNTETELMNLLRRLAHGGRTVILITHATKNVMLADKVVFMVRGGWLGWYGSPDEALEYFAAYQSEPKTDEGEFGFDDVYGILDDPQKGTPEEWAQRFKAHPAYDKYITNPLHNEAPHRSADDPTPERPRQASALRQFFILSRRNLHILIKDRITLGLMLAVPPLIAFFIYVLTYRDMYDPLTGDSSRIMISYTILLFMAMAIGGMTFMREFVKETDIYKRERLVNIKIFPYVMSKVWVATLLGLYQAAAWFAVLYLAVDMPGGIEVAAQIYVCLFFATLTGIHMGLLTSALSPNEGATPMMLAAFIMPQVMFSGALLPITQLDAIGEAITVIMPSRFALEGVVTAGGHGESVVNDVCWQLPNDERRALSAEEKSDCTCLGENIFEICDFPGIRRFYSPVVDQPEPSPPEAPDPTNAEIEEYTEAVSVYLEDLRAYQEARTNWEQGRSASIGGAEGRLEVEMDNFGPIFDVNLTTHWLAQFITVLVFIAGLAGIQRVKDLV